MAICGNCGQESARVKSRWDAKGNRLADECPKCAPEEMHDKFTVPSDKKIWMGYEAHPEEYEKRYDDDGVFYIHKPEYRAEQEQKIAQPCEEDRNAIAKKRKERRTEPMNADEYLKAIGIAREIADAIEQAAREGTDILN